MDEKVIGQRLEKARRSRHLTPEEVSHHLQLPQNDIVAIEAGAIANKLPEIYGLICLYNIPTHDIFEGYFS